VLWIGAEYQRAFPYARRAGGFFAQVDGTLRFAPASALSDLEVARLLASVRRRIVRLVARHGIDLEDPASELGLR